LLTLTVISLNILKLKKFFKIAVLIILLSPSIYFFNGAVGYFLTKQNLGLDKYNYSNSVQIPQEYVDSANQINKDTSSTSIISLPYSGIEKTSTDWVNYQKWGFFGSDILRNLYQKNIFVANSFDSSKEDSFVFKDFNENLNSTSEDLLNIFQQFNGEYIIFHKDISPIWQDKVGHIKDKLEELKNQGKINIIDSNQYFEMYQIKPTYIKPLIYSSSDSENNINKSENFQKNNLTFKKLSPVKYQIELNIKDKEELFFGEAFNDQWKLFSSKKSELNNCNAIKKYGEKQQFVECEPGNNSLDLSEITYLWQNKILENTHKSSFLGTNSWNVDPVYIRQNWDKKSYQENSDGSLTINLTLYYTPQIILYSGAFVSILTLSISIGYLALHSRKK
jgi:hypothetical protein